MQRDFRAAGLSPRDVAMLEFATAVATRSHTVSEANIDELRTHGFTDEQIFDIAVCVGIRNCYSRLIDAVGAAPDPALLDLEPASLRTALAVGRALPQHAPG